MGRTLLIGLIVVSLSAPCLAQPEIESLFSINNTLWELLNASPYSLGFSDDVVYFCETNLCLPVSDSKIKDMLILSTFRAGASSGTEEVSLQGIAFPFIELGYVMVCTSTTGCNSTFMMKIDDNWLPE